jgi:hypothetical protein
LAIVPLAVAAFATPLTAHALAFTTVFDSSVDATAQADITTYLAEYGSLFSDNVTVSLKFTYSGAGLGSTLSYSWGLDYQTFHNALIADATSAADTTALARIAIDGAGTSNPVNGTSHIVQGRAGLAAVGINVDTSGISNYYDGEVDLNLGIMNYDRTSIDPNKYDLKAVLQHEVDEVLGSISNVGETDPRVVDLFRYDAGGNRSFNADNSPTYFSIDGTTLLAQLNNTISNGDFGDFASCPSGAAAYGNAPQVQDACSTPGSSPDLNTEITLLDVVGWDRITTTNPVPEPGSLALMLAGLAGFAARRRKG